MQIFKAENLILTAHSSVSYSLQNSFRLIFVHRRVSCTKILTSPFLKDFMQYFMSSLYWSVYVKSVSESLRWCSVQQSTWGKFGDKKLINSYVLFNRPLMFWWYTLKLFVLFEFDRGSLLAWGCNSTLMMVSKLTETCRW